MQVMVTLKGCQSLILRRKNQFWTKTVEIEGRRLSGKPDELMAWGRVKNWCSGGSRGKTQQIQFLNFQNLF